MKLKNTRPRRNLFTSVILPLILMLVVLSLLGITGCAGTGESRQSGPITYSGTSENYFIDTDRKTEMLLTHWEMGGLVALHCNFPSPWTGGSVYDFEKNGGEYSDIYTPGKRMWT